MDMLRFEWDERKRARTLEIRGLDFLDSAQLFDGRAVMTAPAAFEHEVRYVSTALLNDGKSYTVVWTWREAACRIISFRRARREEERAYRRLFG